MIIVRRVNDHDIFLLVDLGYVSNGQAIHQQDELSARPDPVNSPEHVE